MTAKNTKVQIQREKEDLGQEEEIDKEFTPENVAKHYMFNIIPFDLMHA